MNRKKFLPLIAVLLIALLAPVISGAQGETILTVAVPQWMADQMKDAFADFEAAHPGVKVVIKGVEQSFYAAPPFSEMDEYLESAADYAAQGDVIYMQGPYNLSPEAVRAGLYLDLWPLAQTDPRMAAENFYGPMWESFQWDGGMWAVPVGGSFTLLIYDVDAFDAAGLAYPDDSWTFDQLMNAARTLTTDEVPGILLFESAPLLMSAFDISFIDDSVMPAQPDFDKPALIEVMDTWRALEEEGVIGIPGPEMDYDIQEVPIRMETMFAILFPQGVDGPTLAGAMLPGGKADMNVSAVTVSAGTQYPELSYELAVYFSQIPELQQFIMYDNVFARRDTPFPSEGPFANLAPEVMDLITSAGENAIPFAEKRFGNYVSDALRRASVDQLDPQTALEEAEQKALDNLQIAAGAGVQVAVATPIPTPQLAAGETRLNLGLINVWQLPNEDSWHQALTDFAAGDPEVGDVVLNRPNTLPYDAVEDNDCLFVPYLDQTLFDLVLPVGPFMDADPTFDRADLLPGVLDAVTVGGQVMGVPLVIMPNMLWYNADIFEQAGAALPVNGWTVDGFADTLQMLDTYVNTDDPLMQLQTYGNGYLLMLAAAYGGMPMDFTTNPPTPQLTDPANVDALRQVLDFAKAGHIQYDELDARGGGGGGGSGPIDTTPFYTDYLSWMSFRAAQHLNQNSEFNMGNYKMTTYPAGSTYTPLSYGVGAGYISADAPNPAACYRLLSTLSQRPDLFMAMPARRSALNTPEIAALPPDVAAFYADYAAQMDAPNAIIFPDPYRSGGPAMDPSKHLLMMWFNKALDNYVLRDADLESELAQAQDYMTEFLTCTDGIEKANTDLMNGTPEQISAYYEQFTDCVIAVDPSRAEQFAPTPAP